MSDNLSLKVVIEALDKATAPLKNLQKQMNTFASTTKKLGSNLSLALTAPIVGAGVFAFKEFEEHRKNVKMLENQLKNMGMVGTGELEKLTGSAQKLATELGIDDDKILEVQKSLLSFKNINTDDIIKIQQEVLDIASEKGLDSLALAEKIGQALSNPKKAAKLLESQLGNIFTNEEEDQLKKLAKAGDVLKAKFLILNKLEGKSKDNLKDTLSSTEKAIASISELAESFGKLLAPSVDAMATTVKGFVDTINKLDDSTKKTIVNILGVAAAIGPLLWITGTMAGAIVNIINLTKSFAPLMSGLLNLIKLNPIVAGLTLALGVGYLIYENWDSIKKIFDNVVKSFQIGLSVIKIALSDAFGDLRNLIISPFVEAQKAVSNLANSFSRLTGAKMNIGVQQSMIPASLQSQNFSSNQKQQSKIIVDFKNLPKNTSVKTERDKNMSMDLNLGYQAYSPA